MDLQTAIASTEGHIWSSEKEVGTLLASLMKLTGMSVVLESGVFKGRTACYLIDALPKNGKYFGIDVEDHRPAEVKRYMDGHHFILEDSRTAIKKLPAKYFDLIFIDSVHTQEFLRVEFKECERVIKTGGYICLHDAHIDGIKAFINYCRKFQWFEVMTLDTLDEWGNNRGIAIIKCNHARPHIQPGEIKGIFTEIYQTNFWRSPESRSGSGSEIKATESIRAWLLQMIEKYNIKSMTDCACGDFNWMKLVNFPEGFHYTGVDIVNEMIAFDKRTYAYERPDREFLVCDLTKEVPPRADLLFCKDVFIHLSFEDIKQVLMNMGRSGSRYLILSNANGLAENKDKPTCGGWRPINILAEPFNAPAPIEVFDAGVTQMAMFDLSE